MVNSQEKRIINSCNTCRNPIYEGEIIWSSQTGESSGYTKGVYGGASHNTSNDTSIHGGVYGAHHTGQHSTENWIQCGWCYDQWQAEIIAHKRWEDKKGFWILLCIPFAGVGYLSGWLIKAESNYPLIFGGVGFLIGFLVGFVISAKKAGPEPIKPYRYRFRKRPTKL